MRQEEKQILLKDLSARLPYGVKISIPELWTNEEKIETLNEIFKGDDDLYRVNSNGMLIKYIKPYLFPLSNMTEEQIAQLEFWAFMKEYHKITDFYYENHIDFSGLVEKGLAIDATGKNIY